MRLLNKNTDTIYPPLQTLLYWIELIAVTQYLQNTEDA